MFVHFRTTNRGAIKTMSGKLLDSFIGQVQEMLDSISEMFSEDEDCKSAVNMFSTFIKTSPKGQDKFIRKCNELFIEHGDMIKERDCEGIFAIAENTPILDDLDLRGKWAEFDDESKNNLWGFIKNIKIYSELYCAVPTSVLGEIEELANGLGDQIKNGTIDLNSLDLNAISKQLLEKMDENDTKSLEENLPHLFSSLSGAVGDMMGKTDIDLQKILKSVMKSDGTLDISAMPKVLEMARQ
jgi:hypothetical protein